MQHFHRSLDSWGNPNPPRNPERIPLRASQFYRFSQIKTSIKVNLTSILLKCTLGPMTADPSRWFLQLEEEDQQFVKRLVLASGSLKELAEGYDVSYPTIRLRLDRLIERIRSSEDPLSDAFETKVRQLVAEGDVSARIGKQLLRVHKETKKGESK